jgi:D-alanine transaminase
MPHVTYVNGSYVRHADAAVHVEDRGYQFADGVYEVIAIRHGRLVDGEGHFTRLNRSLGELSIAWPMSRKALQMVIAEVVRRNRVRHGMVYLQITRGVAPRNHAFPKNAQSALVITARSTPAFDLAANLKGVDVVTMPDIRWKRCDIKSVSLLPNILGKQQALEKGAYEGWMIDEKGRVTEGTSSNAWIVTAKGELITRQTGDDAILDGITRRSVLAVARAAKLKLVERPFTVKEALAASEAFLTSTTSFVKPVVRIDGKKVGAGKVGPIAERLLALYGAHMDKSAA